MNVCGIIHDKMEIVTQKYAKYAIQNGFSVFHFKIYLVAVALFQIVISIAFHVNDKEIN